MDDETIISESNLGQRLEKIMRSEKRALRFQGQDIPIVGQISIGREKDNTIVIENKMASRHHAIIQKIKEEYYIKDLGSTNGTVVNGNRIPEDKYLKLKKGDMICIGKSELYFL